MERKGCKVVEIHVAMRLLLPRCGRRKCSCFNNAMSLRGHRPRELLTSLLEQTPFFVRIVYLLGSTFFVCLSIFSPFWCYKKCSSMMFYLRYSFSPVKYVKQLCFDAEVRKNLCSLPPLLPVFFSSPPPTDLISEFLLFLTLSPYINKRKKSGVATK